MSSDTPALRTGEDTTSSGWGLSPRSRKLSLYCGTMAIPSWSTARGASPAREIELSGGFVANCVQVLQYPTGQETFPVLQEAVLSLVARIDLEDFSTGYGALRSPLLTTSPRAADLSEPLSETDDRSRVVVRYHRDWTTQEKKKIAAALPAAEQTPEASAASRIREISGLEADKIADLLGVTRQGFYAWLGGTKPRGKRRDHLMQVLHIMEEAARRSGGPRETAAWLMTPSAASNRVPFELLKAHEYDLCRSLLTRSTTPRPALRPPRKRLAPGQLREAVDRLTSRAAGDDDDNLEDE